MRKLILAAAVFAVAGPGAGAASAQFVCPIMPIPQQAIDNASKANDKSARATLHQTGGGDWTFLPGRAGDPANSPLDVPEQATNLDGAGDPTTATYAVQGEEGYSPIWNQP